MKLLFKLISKRAFRGIPPRGVLPLLICASVCLCAAAQDNGAPFDYNELRNRAQNLSVAPYRPAAGKLPRELRACDYDEMRSIRFDPKEAVWRRERRPFQLQFFHRGGSQTDRVRVNAVDDGVAEPIPFSKNLFDYSQSRIRGRLSDKLGFNGFRIHCPLNSMEYLDEVAVFQGASYFRALAQGLRYGLSARGLAIDVVAPVPEEFPSFVEYWVEKPDIKATFIKFYALLDSPGVTGAYEIVLTPGVETVMDIKVTLFPRRVLACVGLAPLTSMFWFGEYSPSRFGDFRPEVHDSDGLLMHNGSDEWLWRPLSNEGRIRTSYFADNHPRGFGLMQRDRDFSSYEDLEAVYQSRPSAWVVPASDWGRGEVCLLELPTDTEFADNIVAFWKPEKMLLPQQPYEFSYGLHWFADDFSRPPLARTVASRFGSVNGCPDGRKFVLDFSDYPAMVHPDLVQPVVSLTNGELRESHLQYNDVGRSWRVFFDVLPIDRTQPVEIRCFLESDGAPRSETWTYFWNP